MDEEADSIPSGASASDAETQKISPSELLNLLAAGAAGVTRELRGWQPPSVEDLQRMLPQYEISAFIARGGMGAVYKGEQKTLKRAVAIKVLPPEIEDGDLQYAARFKHEAQAMARLSHPNIVAVFDAGEVELGRADDRGGALGPPSAVSDARRLEDQPPYPDGGLGTARPTLLYFVMEFIEGTDVAQLIASEGRLEPVRAVPIITAVCEALAFAHEEGIIHRDIKPSNIMIDKKGRVKVADFGLAKAVNLESTMLTGSNVAMGTPDFIAPEALIPGIAVDGRADVYAVGVMLYQMLTGKIPRGRFDSPSQVVPQMGKGFDAIVDKAMQTDRDRRYSTAGELKADVERVSQLVPKERAGRTSWKARSTSLAAAAVIVLGAGAWMMWKKSLDKPIAQISAPAVWHPVQLPDADYLKRSGSSVNAAGEWRIVGGMALPGLDEQDIAVRGELRLRADSKDPFIQFRRSEAGARQFSLHRGEPYLWLQSMRMPGYKFDPVSKLDLSETTTRSMTERWIPFTFAVKGEVWFARLDSKTYPLVRSKEILGPGQIQLNMMDLRSLEVLRLNDFPEDEALRLITAPESKVPALRSPFIVWQKLAMPGTAVLDNSGSTVRANGELHVGRGTPIPNFKASNLALRGEVKLDAESTGSYVGLRGGPMSRQFTLNPRSRDIWITMPKPEGDKTQRSTIGKLALPDKVSTLTEGWIPFEFAAVGRQSFLRLGGTPYPPVDGDDTTSAGEVIFGNNATFRHLEALNLDPLSDADALKRLEEEWKTPQPAPVLEAGTRAQDPQKVDAIWKARWHKPGRLRAAGTTIEGKPFDLTAAGSNDDFVQVMALSPKIERGRSWLALRSNGIGLMSDGASDPGFVGIAPMPVKSGGYWTVAGQRILSDPVTAFSYNTAKFHAASPGIEAWADLQGVWHVRSKGYDEGLIARPDVTAPPHVTKVVCGNSGTAVLRTDGTLRIWNSKEVSLPDELKGGITEVVSMGIPWAVLKTDGRVLRFEVTKATANGLDPLPAAGDIRQLAAGPVIALRDTGYGSVWKLKSGRWTMGPGTPLEPTLQALFEAGNESFDIFSDGEKAGILWIEPPATGK